MRQKMQLLKFDLQKYCFISSYDAQKNGQKNLNKKMLSKVATGGIF